MKLASWPATTSWRARFMKSLSMPAMSFSSARKPSRLAFWERVTNWVINMEVSSSDSVKTFLATAKVLAPASTDS